MLRALRRRLTLLFTALTALVLAAALLVSWQLAAQQYRQGNEALFSGTLAALCDRLAGAGLVEDSWLGEQEVAARCTLLLQDNGTPFAFAGRWPTRTSRETLRALALDAAAQAGLDPTLRDRDDAVPAQTVYFSLTGAQGEPYQCAAALMPRGGGGYLLLLLLQDASGFALHTRLMALQYAGLWLLGAAALAGISWWLAGLALAPTRQAVERQNAFIAAASHELRSPLAVIKASLDAAAGPPLPPGQSAALLRAAGREADRMARLTDDLLLLAGSDAHALACRLAPTELDTLCIELYDQFYLLAARSGHPLTLRLPEGAAPPVPADAGRLKQLLTVLLNNALDHTPPGTPVELALQLPANKKAPVMLAVVDHGLGIPDAEKGHIFERFYRGDQSRTGKAHFGLGLSIAAELARGHGARLTVQDTPGGGATFALALRPGAYASQPSTSA